MEGEKEAQVFRAETTTDIGYPPLQVHRRDGRLYLDDGTELQPTIPVGPEDHHLAVFIEYERSFGRGRAKYVTHDPENYDRDTHIQKYGAGFGEEYRELAGRYTRIATMGTVEEAEAFIDELKDYRTRHRGLYTENT